MKPWYLRTPGVLALALAAQIIAAWQAHGPVFPWAQDGAEALAYAPAHVLLEAERPAGAHLSPFARLLGSLLPGWPDAGGRPALFVLNLGALILAQLLALARLELPRGEKAVCMALAGAMLALNFPFFVMAQRTPGLQGLGVLGAVTGALLADSRRGAWAGGACAAFGAALYPPLLVLAPMAAALRHWRWLGGAGLGAAALYLLAPGAWNQWLPHAATTGWLFLTAKPVAQTSALLANTFHTLPEALHAANAWWLAAGALLAVLPLGLCMLQARGFASDEKHRSSAALLPALTLTLFLPGSGHPLAAAMVLPAVPFIAWQLAERDRRALALLLAISLALVSALTGRATPDCRPYPWAAPALLLGLSGMAALRVYGTPVQPAQASATWSIRALSWLARPTLSGGLGAACSAGAVALYYRQGFGFLMCALWAAGLAGLFTAFGGTALARANFPRLRRRDAWALVLLLALFTPVFTFYVWDIPYQMVTDEVSFTGYMRGLLREGKYDVFGIAVEYLWWPRGCFLFIAGLTQFLGGVSLETIRLVNGLLGLATLALFFVLARQRLSTGYAFACAAMLGGMHAYVAISRMALRDTIPVLLEVIALLLLYRGMLRQRTALLFLAGVTAGLGVYNYFSARIVIVICAAFLALWAWRLEGARPWLERMARLFKRGLPLAAGYLACAAPMLLLTYQNRDLATLYTREQSVLFHEGREVARVWTGSASQWDGVLLNTWRGLALFNNGLHDHSGAYVNTRHGFVDPLTGVLLWVGVAGVLWRRRRGAFGLLMLAGFFTVWLFVGALTNKNPAYCRFLVVVPFVAYFTVAGARLLAHALCARVGFLNSRRVRGVLVGTVLAAAIAWNGKIYYDYYRQGVDEGEIVGATMRFVAARKHSRHYTFYIVMDQQYPYHPFGGDFWRLWVGSFVAPHQTAELVRSNDFTGPEPRFIPASRPCTLLMNGPLWALCGEKLRARHPDITVTPLIPGEQAQVAIEFPALEAPRPAIPQP